MNSYKVSKSYTITQARFYKVLSEASWLDTQATCGFTPTSHFLGAWASHLHFKQTSRFPWWLSGEESACQCMSPGFDPWSGRIPHATEWLSLRVTTNEPVLWSPGATSTERKGRNCWSQSPRACALQQERPPQWEAHASQLECNPHLLQLEKSLCSAEDPS